MDKLTYKRINDNLIMIDLHNGYTIIAIISWQKESHDYDVQLMLKKDNIDTWSLIEQAEHLIFETNYKFIYNAVLKQVAKYFEEGFFDYYIQRFEFEQKCFSKGIEVFKDEGIGDK